MRKEDECYISPAAAWGGMLSRRRLVNVITRRVARPCKYTGVVFLFIQQRACDGSPSRISAIYLL